MTSKNLIIQLHFSNQYLVGPPCFTNSLHLPCHDHHEEILKQAPLNFEVY